MQNSLVFMVCIPHYLHCDAYLLCVLCSLLNARGDCIHQDIEGGGEQNLPHLNMSLRRMNDFKLVIF